MDSLELDYDNFVPRLLIEVAEFEPMYREHIRDNDDELLPHVLMADFSCFLRGASQSMLSDRNGGEWRHVIERSADLLDRALASPDGQLRQLSLSFLENLDPRIEADRALKGFWGLRLQEALDLYYADWRE